MKFNEKNKDENASELFLKSLDLQFFGDGEGESTPPEGAEKQPNDPPTGNEPSDDAEKSADGKTFTQKELDEIVAKRLERERKKYADYDELKTKATEYEQKQEEQRIAALTETERAQELAKQHEETIANLQKEMSEKEARSKQRLIKAEFVKFAEKAGIIDVDAAMLLSDLSAVEVDENDNVTGAKEIVDALVESKPYLVGKQQKQVGQPTNPGTATYKDKSAEQMLAEARAKAKKTGRAEDRIAYNRLKKELKK